LLQWALRQVLGDAVKQQGSLVCPDYLRFDFTWPRALSKEEIRQVESLIQDKIDEDVPVTTAVMPIEQAKQAGATALFGEKYGEMVRVVAVGAASADRLDEAFSKELCGGTHVSSTGQIGGFLIIKEESVAAGVRRITALTGPTLMRYLSERSRIVDELVEMLKTPAEQIVVRVGKLVEDNKVLTKQLKSAGRSGVTDTMAQAAKLYEQAERIGGTAVIVGQIPESSIEQMRTAMDSLKKKAKSAVIVLGTADGDGKVTLLAGVTDDLIKTLKAGDIVKQIAPVVGGGGGGRPQMAQAGGKDADKLPDALEKAKDVIRRALAW
jgi:alanyl-tRNA synthetase